jgi:hypothetical protein
MQARVLDLDGAVLAQPAVLAHCRPRVVPLREWGARLRMACAFGRFRTFERDLAAAWPAEDGPSLTLYGSGDFHHVSLALLRRLREPFNLLVLDKHPDWMRGIPFLHCGTWLHHAVRSSAVQRVYHVGGELDFDNHYRWLAPWPDLINGKVTVFPAVRAFRRGLWARVANEPLRPGPSTPLTPDCLGMLLRPFAADLARWPLYISVDKDVLIEADAAVNWDSGHLFLAEAAAVIEAFVAAAGGRVAGMDLVGDWSPVQVRGTLRHILHRTEHPVLRVDPAEAARRNEQANLALLAAVACGRRACPPGNPAAGRRAG